MNNTDLKLNRVRSDLSNMATNLPVIENLLNIDDFLIGYFDDPRSGTEVVSANAGYITSGYIEVEQGRYIIGGTLNTSKTVYSIINPSFLMFLDKDKHLLSYQQSVSLNNVLIPTNCCYIRYTFATSTTLAKFKGQRPFIAYTDNVTSASDLYNKYVPYGQHILNTNIYGMQNILSWKGKNWVSYGDSITALGNTLENGWQLFVHKIFEMGNYYGRGIGGQTYTYNKKPWFANSDGSYNSRDDNGDMTNPSSYTVPSGCTAHYGYFASWDRIKTMIPDSIKDNIDLIFLFGVNDCNVDYSYSIPAFQSGATLDAEWSSATENALSGDYDITTLSGAIASTIMKLQARCPNAVIVLGTGWSGRGDDASPTSNMGNYTQIGLNLIDNNEVVKSVCKYFSINCIDLWSTSGVNPLNRNLYDTDVIHPNSAKGSMALARSVISGLKNICSNI